MQYIKVSWKHQRNDQPIFLYGEIDDEQWETRHIEVYVDGSYTFTDGDIKVGKNIFLVESRMDEKMLDMNFKDENEEVRLDYIGQSEFEDIWRAAQAYAESKKLPIEKYTG